MYYTEYDIPSDAITVTLPDGVDVRLEVSPDDGRPEDCFASGDDSADASLCAEIREQSGRGNDWAWCTVRVTVTDGDATGECFLGAVVYFWDEHTPNDAAIVRAFMADNGDWMVSEALGDYQAEAKRLRDKYAKVTV
jgi:hypothetical protein